MGRFLEEEGRLGFEGFYGRYEEQSTRGVTFLTSLSGPKP